MNLNPLFTRKLAIDMKTIQSTTADGISSLLDHFPDQPNVRLQADTVRNFLEKELETPVLGKMHDWLWICATKNSKRIDPLHQQAFKGQTIIPIEDPALHLIWFRDSICTEPIPLALLNHYFWRLYLNGSGDEFDRKIVLGFLRSYRRLVRHPSDFKIAMNRGLILPTTTWLQWTRFIEGFGLLRDVQVANRHHFGQIRLSRLNVLIRFLRSRQSTKIENNRHCYTTRWYTADYSEKFVGPGLFVFASVSLLLSAMQVILSLPTEIDTRTWVKENTSLSFAFWGFCVTVLVLLAFSWLHLLAGPIFYMIAQQVFGYDKKKKFDRNMSQPEHP